MPLITILTQSFYPFDSIQIPSWSLADPFFYLLSIASLPIGLTKIVSIPRSFSASLHHIFWLSRKDLPFFLEEYLFSSPRRKKSIDFIFPRCGAIFLSKRCA